MVPVAHVGEARATGDDMTAPPAWPVGVGEASALRSPPASGAASIAEMLELRAAANSAFFTSEADRTARLCATMADRFVRRGRLLAVGASPAARSDARHVAVEFMHPVIVGKRALPALGLAGDPADVAEQLTRLVRPDDIVTVFGATDEYAVLTESLASCRRRGCLTIAFEPIGAEVELQPPTDDPFVRQESVETLYHVLWELVHVFFEHGTATTKPEAHPGHSAFLYPFLAGATNDRAAIIRDVSESVVAKMADVNSLRARMLDERGAADLARTAREVALRLDAGGAVLAFGNGGSATDAMDLVADLRAPPSRARLQPRRALDLTEDSSILTALANDVGVDVVYARQIAALAGPDDVAVAFSTSGNSRNVIAALDEARRRGALTVAFTGYDGGQIAHDGHAEHVINAPSQHIPRIQEAHAAGYHILRALIG